MRHVEGIRALVRTLHQSQVFHALVIESPPGWAKSSTVEKVLEEMGLKFGSLGAYSSPLQLYVALKDTGEGTLVVDDCAGLFTHPVALSILKAASWESAGTLGQRIVKWRSSSEKVVHPEITFSGKLILLTNSMPSGPGTESFLSRCLYMKLRFDADMVASMIQDAASVTDFYPDTGLAQRVASHLIETTGGSQKINLRTLRMGYELARSNAGNWRELMNVLLPAPEPLRLVESLAGGGGKTEYQVRSFMSQTGLSRRTFFNYRRAVKGADTGDIPQGSKDNEPATLLSDDPQPSLDLGNLEPFEPLSAPAGVS